MRMVSEKGSASHKRDACGDEEDACELVRVLPPLQHNDGEDAREEDHRATTRLHQRGGDEQEAGIHQTSGAYVADGRDNEDLQGRSLAQSALALASRIIWR